MRREEKEAHVREAAIVERGEYIVAVGNAGEATRTVPTVCVSACVAGGERGGDDRVLIRVVQKLERR